MLWSLDPIIKNPFFYLLPENLLLSWTRALPLPEGKRWQVRDSPKVASGSNLLFGEGNKLFGSEKQLLSSPLLRPRRVTWGGWRRSWDPVQAHKHVCMWSVLRYWGHSCGPGHTCPGRRRREERFSPHPNPIPFTGADQGLQYAMALSYKKTYKQGNSSKFTVRVLNASERKLQGNLIRKPVI